MSSTFLPTPSDDAEYEATAGWYIAPEQESERRYEYLERVALHEGGLFLSRYLNAYRAAAPEGEVLDAFGHRHVLPGRRLAWAYRSIFPQASREAFGTYLRTYATDPQALTEDRIDRPTRRIDSLHFATGTPYETTLARSLPEPRRVLSADLCEVVRGVLRDAVEQGTAVFGTIVAYVEGPQADAHEFTSSLTAAILTVVGPQLAPLFEGDTVAVEGGEQRTEERLRSPASRNGEEERPS